MSSPPSSATTQAEPRSAPTVDVLTRDDEVGLVVENTDDAGESSHYSMLVHGEIQASSILSTGDPAATVTVLDDDTTLVAGSLGGGTAGFVLDGQVVAAEFDGTSAASANAPSSGSGPTSHVAVPESTTNTSSWTPWLWYANANESPGASS